MLASGGKLRTIIMIRTAEVWSLGRREQSPKKEYILTIHYNLIRFSHFRVPVILQEGINMPFCKQMRESKMRTFLRHSHNNLLSK